MSGDNFNLTNTGSMIGTAIGQNSSVGDVNLQRSGEDSQGKMPTYQSYEELLKGVQDLDAAIGSLTNLTEDQRSDINHALEEAKKSCGEGSVKKKRTEKMLSTVRETLGSIATSSISELLKGLISSLIALP